MRVLLLLILYASASLVTCAQARSSNSAIPNDLFPAELFAPLPAPYTPQSDLAIVFWFDWHDPAGTLRHQVYDRRKGEFTPAVHEWLAMVRRQYPDYVTSVRYVDVGQRDVGGVVRETVDATRRALEEASAQIRREHRSRRLGGLGRSYGGPGVYVRPRMRPGRWPQRFGINGAPGAGGIVPSTPLPYPFPTPYPYPRPHP